MEPARLAPLAARLRSLGPISDEALAALYPLVSARSYEADAWLLRAGELARQCHWIERGLIREYYIGEDGHEHIRRFMLALTARERLAQWQRENAQLDARVSRKHLASYLGVTPEHLSRLRRAER